MSGTVRRGPLPEGGLLGSPRADAAFERFVRHRDPAATAPEVIRPRRVDWTPVGFPEDPTPGDVGTVEALRAAVSAEAERLTLRADPAAVTLTALADALRAWSACLSSAQDAAVAALRAAEEAEEDRALATMSVRLLTDEHEALIAALRAVEKAPPGSDDGPSPGMHLTGWSDVGWMRRRAEAAEAELTAAHHRLDDAQQRLAHAWSAAREAEKESHAGETRLIRALDETADGVSADRLPRA